MLITADKVYGLANPKNQIAQFDCISKYLIKYSEIYDDKACFLFPFSNFAPSYMRKGMWKIKLRKALFVILLFLTQLGLMAQSDTVTLKEIQVSSVANPVRFRKIPRQVGIISQKEIKNVPVNSLGGLLEQAGGLDLRKRGAFGMQADLDLAGGSFDQALIMINGIPVNDPQTGHHNLDQPLNLNDVDKIEIVRGPSSRWFGPNAFSGAINIITKREPGDNLTLAIRGGQYGYFSASLLAGYNTGHILNYTSVRGSRSNGYRINTDFKDLSISHQSFFTVGASKWNLQLGYVGKSFGANSFYTGKYPDQYEKIKVMSAGLGIRGGHKLEYHGNIHWRRLYDRFELFREGKNWYQKEGGWFVKGVDSAGFHTPAGFFPYQGPNFHRTDVAGAEGSVGLKSKIGKTAAGFSYQYENILSNVLGDPMKDTVFSKIDKGAFYNHHKSRQQLNAFLNQLYQKQNFSLSAGVNVFYNADYGFMLSPGIDISWFITGNLKTYVSANRAIRLPTFTDLYYEGPDHISNSQLKPEKTYGFSGGVQYFMKAFTFSASLSYRLGSDIIDWIKKSPNAKWESMNLTQMNTLGAGFSFTYIPPKPDAQIVKSVRINYHYLYSNKSATGYVSLYALDYLRHNLSIYFRHAIFRKLSAGWTFAIQKRNGDYFDYIRNMKVPYNTVFLLNTKLMYQLSHFTVSVQVNNLLNQTYRDIGSVVMPGIWITGGVQYHVSLKKK